ncbi:MAG: 4Fe-4S dicluster domain-containing protein [Deltaproteobacteria bacterium]|jgi:heterodisulfide reductase subunit C|nr:4Fe-4S dicluster domain-containing protein [Deltaproteobacteria bacterium]
MNPKPNASPAEIVNWSQTDSGFAGEAIRRSGVVINKCCHCQTCAGGCPFVRAMDYPPNRVIRLVQLGLRREALESSGIWICVGCNTCSIQCPNCIDIPAVNDALRQMAMAEGVVIAEPNILNFHQAVLQSIQRHGRTHKLEVMMRYKLKKHDWFSDMAVGMKMFTKRKLELLPSKSKNIAEIRRIFDQKSTA